MIKKHLIILKNAVVFYYLHFCICSALTRSEFSDGSNSTLVERKPDVFGFSIKMPSCVGVITHEDPLDQNAIKKASTTENQTGVVCETITKMVNTASAFFDRATNLKLGVQSLQEQRRTFDYLYSGDHLRYSFEVAIL